MIRVLPSSSDFVLGVEITGTLGETEHLRLLGLLTRALRKHGRLSVLVEPEALGNGIAFARVNPHAVRRLAVVGEGTWALRCLRSAVYLP